MDLGTTISKLRKAKKWSQGDLAKNVSASREVVGKYERNEVTPSIQVAKKIADVFGVSLDYLAGEGEFVNVDKATLERLKEIEQLPNNTKEHLLFLIDSVLRDTKVQKAYK